MYCITCLYLYYSGRKIGLNLNLKGKVMFKTNASMRRFLMLQKSTYKDAPKRVWDRYRIYVECVGFSECPKTFNQWLDD